MREIRLILEGQMAFTDQLHILMTYHIERHAL